MEFKFNFEKETCKALAFILNHGHTGNGSVDTHEMYGTFLKPKYPVF